MREYRQILAVPGVLRVLVLGLVVRVPVWAGGVILTLHVVSHLHRSYAEAGLLGGAATVALAISGPWRGRRLDELGLRRALVPSLLVLAVCWSIAPFVGYLPLLLLASLAGLFEIPHFSIVRQTLLHSVPETQRRTVLSVDAVAVEISFMIGPVLGVLFATYTNTTWALFGCELASVAGGVLIYVANPPLRAKEDDEPVDSDPTAPRWWANARVLAVLLAGAAAVVVLAGTDVAIVAALRHLGHQSWIGWELAVWGLGSAVGGVLYGALRRSIPPSVLLALLSITTAPVALARDALAVGALLFVAGLFCAPTITATVDVLSQLVPARVRGEALGWHGSALTAGSAVGAPLAGIAVDAVGWPGGFVLPAIVGLAIAGVMVLVDARLPAPADQAVADAPADDDRAVQTGARTV